MKSIGIQAASLGGSFHEMAAIEFYGETLVEHTLVPVYDHAELVERYAQPDSDLDELLIAVDNTTSGRVLSAIEALRKLSPQFSITGSITIKVEQQLLAHPETSIDRITQVLSQKPALDQCDEHIQGSWFTRREHHDTLGAAQLVMKNKGIVHGRTTAAIASSLAAKTSGLRVINPQYNDNPDNATKFWVVSPSRLKIVHGERTALTFEIPDTPGSLLHAVGILSSRRGLNLTDIDSHLSPLKKGKRGFFVEVEQRSGSIQKTVAQLQKAGYHPTVLGSYTPIQPMEVTQPNGSMPPALRHDTWRGREGLRHQKGSQTLYIETDHQSGALYRMLGHLTEINLLDLGRPVIPKDRHFNRGFYAVVPPRAGTRKIAKALQSLQSEGFSAKIL